MTKFQALFQEFNDAVARLEEVLREPKTEFMRDSAIKRFELSFDLSWKLIKASLEEKGVVCTSPIGCFKEAYRQGLIEYEEIWVKLTETRNKTVHTYDEKLAEVIYAGLSDALVAFQKLNEALGKAAEENLK